MSLTYTTFVMAVANFLVKGQADTTFMFAIPNIIDDAELRIYRDLDLLSTVTGGVATLAAGSTVLLLPVPAAGPFVVVQDVIVLTPVGASTADATKNSLLPISKEALTFLYPSSAGSGVPKYFAMFDQASILIGPWSDAAYGVVIYGTIRPLSLSASNPTTLLSTYFPDLLLSAALAIGADYLKGSGAPAADASGTPWEAKYQMQLKSAIAEEARKKFQDQGWTSQSTGPSATPPRT